MLARRYLDNFDWILFFSVTVVSVIGVGVIYSSTAGTPMAGAFHRQLGWLLLGMTGLMAALAVDYHTLAEFSYVFYGLGVVFLAMTLAFGRVVNASKSWLGIGSIGAGLVIVSVRAWLASRRGERDVVEAPAIEGG